LNARRPNQPQRPKPKFDYVKIPHRRSPVNNVVLGQNATLTLESIWRYHALVLIVTIAKTAATAALLRQRQ